MRPREAIDVARFLAWAAWTAARDGVRALFQGVRDGYDDWQSERRGKVDK